MNRRELLKMVSLATGAMVIGGDFLLTGCKNSSLGGPTFSAEDLAFLNEVADTILPATNSPGAKEANVGNFMTVMVNDCYEEKDQQLFHEGIKKLEEESRKKYNKGFTAITAEQRTDLLKDIDKRCSEFNKKVGEEFSKYTPEQNAQMIRDKNKDGKDPRTEKMRENPDYYYTMMKQLTIIGYFNSKIGATQALRYVAVPGKYDGAYPYKKGDKAWATS